MCLWHVSLVWLLFPVLSSLTCVFSASLAFHVVGVVLQGWRTRTLGYRMIAMDWTVGMVGVRGRWHGKIKHGMKYSVDEGAKRRRIEKSKTHTQHA